MPDALVTTLVVVTWLAVGLASAVYLGRHGRRHPGWYAIGLALGPIMLPLALEMAPRHGELLDRVGTALPESRRTVLVAVDGSRESEAALYDAVRDLPRQGTRFVLLTVLDPDLHDDLAARAEADALLARCAGQLPPDGPDPVLETAAGNPAQVILERAALEGADLIVVGRRGRGLSERVLGSAADHLVRHSPLPVLLGPERVTA
jgi:nucleotide-binding universal stress UspA family protein